MNDFELLYDEIHRCRKCQKMDKIKALRKIEFVNTKADVFVISQSLARDTLRKSGINFVLENGNLGRTGNNLEKFLKKFDRTVYPKKDNTIYNSEVTQCYPGKAVKGNGDRKPSSEEIFNCQSFFLRELQLIKPKLILLMGKTSRDCFYGYFLKGISFPKSLTEHINQILQRGVDHFESDGIKSAIIPIQHASGMNPHYSKMIENEKLCSMIKRILH